MNVAALPPDLLPRLIAQALDYGELMLTIEEFGAFWQWTTAHPNAACSQGGRLLVFAQLPVRVLELS